MVTRVAGQLTFVNEGQLGRSGTVRRVAVRLAGPGVDLYQPWLAFSKISRSGTHIAIDAQEDASPVEVPGEGTVSRLMTFAPQTEACAGESACPGSSRLMSDTEFLKRIAPHIGEKLRLTFTATTFRNGPAPPATCEMSITGGLVSYLGENNWYMGRCVSVD